MQFLIIIFLIWRFGLFFIAWIGESVLTFSPRFPYSDVYLIPSGLPSWVWSFANFDGVHYLTIAANGYSAQFTQVFFPLYPLLIGTIQRIMTMISPIIIGLLISNLFFVLSLFMFTKLLELDYKKETIKWILLFTVVFPTSFYFGSIYTESLFFFLVISAFYAARKKHWLAVAVLGSLACATKLIGIFLLPALLWEWYSELKIKNEKFKITDLRSTLYALRSPLSLIPVGLLSYMLYLQVKFGDWLYFWHVQPIFGAERSGTAIVLLPQVIWRYTKILSTVSPFNEIYWISFLELTITILAISLLAIAHLRKVRFSYLIFSWLAIITPTLTGTLSSMPRYALVIFPLYIVFASFKKPIVRIAIMSTLFILFFILTVLFTRGHWVG